MDPEQQQSTKFNLVIAICIVQFLSLCSFSLLCPFYTIKANDKGVSVEVIGMICGIFPVVSILSGFLVGLFLKKIGGRVYVYMCGSFLIITYITILGYLDFVDNLEQFIVLSFVARILGGIGSGANSTACMAILISFDP